MTRSKTFLPTGPSSKLTLRSGSNDTQQNIAIVDLLPGGFELEPEAKKATTDDTAKTDDEPKEQPIIKTGEDDKEMEPAKAEAAGDTSANESAAKVETLPQWPPESVDRRDDRIVLYGKFAPEKMTYSYRIKATSRGNFIVPPSYGESMYDHTLKTRGLADKITVE